MNNNNNNNNRDNEGITTKKGFLISLPGKSKGSGESTINMAKTISSEQSDAPHNKNSENGKNKGFDKKNRNRHQKKTPVSDDAQSPSQSHNRDGKNDRRNDRNDRRDKKHQGKQGSFRDGKNKAHVENSNAPEKKEKSFEARTESVETNSGNRHENRNGKNRHDRKKGHKNHYDNRPEAHSEKPSQEVKAPTQNSGKNPSVTPLSALSPNLSSFSKPTSHRSFANVSDSQPESMLSLEEKYKNAVPLAEQIAAEAEKSRHPLYTAGSGEKQEIIGVRFREAGKIYYFDPCGVTVPFGAAVIVETARGDEYGFTAISNRLIPCESLVSPLKKLVRVATVDDTRKYEANKALEKDGAKIFREKVEKLGLEMNLIYVEYTFDNSKLLFYFTAESRVDFRELVKELAGVFRTRIELRQIGVRDEAKVLGGLGVCGRANCCSTFLGDFAQVSIKMAKDQSLSLNAAKISGACGKLMCCLRYEDKVYEQENARTPKVGALVETPEGTGTVTERNTLKGLIKVALDSEEAAPPKQFSRDEVKVIGHGTSENDGEHDDNADEIKDEE